MKMKERAQPIVKEFPVDGMFKHWKQRPNCPEGQHTVHALHPIIPQEAATVPATALKDWKGKVQVHSWELCTVVLKYSW